MKKNSIILHKDKDGTIVISSDVYNVVTEEGRFDTPNADGYNWDKLLKCKYLKISKASRKDVTSK